MPTSPIPHPLRPRINLRRDTGPGCLVQLIWFVVIGWWLGALALALAWLLNVTILGLPLGLAILNNIPVLLALQTPEKLIETVTQNGATVVKEITPPQLNFFLRAAFFLLIGWWWSGLWLTLAYLLCATLILLPVGLAMFRLTPAMTTLKRY